MMGELGLGLLSFSVGTPPEELRRRLGVYREGIANCTKPIPAQVNDRAAVFTMVNCAPTREESYAVSRESFEWYLQQSAAMVASVPKWIAEMKGELGTYEYLAPVVEMEEMIKEVTLENLLDMEAVVAGDPDDVVRLCRAYEATGADLLLCLVNPFKISHESVVQTIELMGTLVIPEFRK